jgi:hypothetical protein
MKNPKMKTIYTILIGALLVTSCKSDKTESNNGAENKALTIAEKIAYAHGYDNWKNVSKISFTFKVDRDSVKGKGRSWTWNPKENRVTLTTETQSFDYIRSQMDSTHIAADRAFINDKFWLLVPFQLVWDSSATITNPTESEAPISKVKMNKITITYPNNGGGYTPGDAYDIYFNQDYIIKEWTYRKGNDDTPTLSTTFENYKDFNGIKIAIDHKRPNSSWNLNFSNVDVTTD